MWKKCIAAAALFLLLAGAVTLQEVMSAGEPDGGRNIDPGKTASGSDEAPAESPAEQPAKTPADEDDLKRQRVLETRDDVEFVDTPLNEAIAFLSEKHGIEIYLATDALNVEGIDSETPVTLSLDSVSLKSVLRIMLAQVGLTFVVRDGGIAVTTLHDAEASLVVKAYPVADLVGRIDSQTGEAFQDTGSLIELLMMIVSPDSWDVVGGPGGATAHESVLVVSQTYEAHEEVSQLLATIRFARQAYAANSALRSMSVFPAEDTPAVRKLHDALQTRNSFSFNDTPLNEAADFLSERYGFPLILDGRALADEAIAVDMPITIETGVLTLESALRRMLREHGMTAIVKDEVLLITTSTAASYQPSIRVYPIHDLVSADESTGNETNTLIDTITSIVAPDTWDGVGGPGSVSAWDAPPLLVVAQADEVHSQVEKMLAELRRAKTRQPKTDEMQFKVSRHKNMSLGTYSIDRTGENPSDLDAEKVAELLREWLVDKLGEMPNGAFVKAISPTVIAVYHSEQGHNEVRELMYKLPGMKFGSGFGGSGPGGFF